MQNFRMEPQEVLKTVLSSLKELKPTLENREHTQFVLGNIWS